LSAALSASPNFQTIVPITAATPKSTHVNGFVKIGIIAVHKFLNPKVNAFIAPS